MNAMSEVETLDIELLNQHFATEKEFRECDICYCCSKKQCECCGNDTDCGTSPSKCTKVQKQKEAFEPIQEEHFQHECVNGLEMLLNLSRIIGVLPGGVDIQALSEHFKADYKKLVAFQLILRKDNDSVYEIISRPYLEIEQVKPKGIFKRRKKQDKTEPKEEIPTGYYSRSIIDKTRELLTSPNFYYCPEKPLIMQDDNYTVLIAHRVSN